MTRESYFCLVRPFDRIILHKAFVALRKHIGAAKILRIKRYKHDGFYPDFVMRPSVQVFVLHEPN